jgi:hypothetical protein
MQFQVLRTVMFLEINRTARVRKASRYFPKRNVIIGSYFPEQQKKVQNKLGIKNYIAWNETLSKRKILDYYICYKNIKLFPLTEMCPVNNNGKINIFLAFIFFSLLLFRFPNFFPRNFGLVISSSDDDQSGGYTLDRGSSYERKFVMWTFVKRGLTVLQFLACSLFPH